MAGVRHFSDEQRAAVVRAALDDGCTPRMAVERAAAGELGLEAFEPAVSSVQRWIEEAKRRRGTDTTDAYRERLQDVVATAVDVIEAQMAKVKQSSAQGRLDLPAAKRALQLSQHVARLLPLLDGKAQLPPAPQSRSPGQASEFLQALLASSQPDQAPAETNGAAAGA